MKKTHKIFIVLLSAILLCGCAHIGEIEVQDFKIKNVSPESFSSVSIGLELKIKNEGPAINIQSLSGEVFYDGSPMGTFVSTDFTLPARKTEWVSLTGGVAMDSSASIVNLLQILQKFDSEKVSISFDALASVGTVKKKFHQEQMSISELMAKFNREK